MLNENYDAAEAGDRVGYDDASHSANTTGTLANRRCGLFSGGRIGYDVLTPMHSSERSSGSFYGV
jgi:hypothetical protein